jgi:hypothetical protein
MHPHVPAKGSLKRPSRAALMAQSTGVLSEPKPRISSRHHLTFALLVNVAASLVRKFVVTNLVIMDGDGDKPDDFRAKAEKGRAVCLIASTSIPSSLLPRTKAARP